LSLWKSVVDHVPVSAVIASLSLHGRIEYVNHEFTIVTGYEIGDVPTVADWIEKAYPDPDYRALVMGNWQVDASPNHMRRDVSYDVVCRDGTTKRMLLRASLLGPERMIVTMADVTGQHEAEAALRASEARYRALVESSPVPIAVTRGGRILQANAAVAVLFGASAPDALVGRATADLILPFTTSCDEPWSRLLTRARLRLRGSQHCGSMGRLSKSRSRVPECSSTASPRTWSSFAI
jgi:PAS domain S-box-containing protein